MSDDEGLNKFLNQIGSIILAKYALKDFNSFIIDNNASSTDNYSFLDKTHVSTCVFCYDDSSDDVCGYLKNLLHKPVSIARNNGKTYVYWGEGDLLKNAQLHAEIVPIDKDIVVNNTVRIHSGNISKTSTRLPAWLDNMIFNKLNGLYSPDHVRYTQNTDLSDEELKVYLGTYFPRSYAESFCIYDDLFKNKFYLNAVSKRKTFQVLDLGTGTGGNIIGLIMAMHKNQIEFNSMNIFVQDCHTKALESFNSIISSLITQTGLKINLKTFNKIISSKPDLLDFIKDFKEGSFDYISSFKMISEVITQDPSENYTFYYDMACSLLPLTSPIGTLLLLDVTIKSPLDIYYPILMNNYLKKFECCSDSFRTLSPVSCYHHGAKCGFQCFTQQQFRITHSKKLKDLSKVSYRLLARKSFVDEILKEKQNIGKFVIVWNNSGKVMIPDKFCFNSLNEDKIIDSYKLS